MGDVLICDRPAFVNQRVHSDAPEIDGCQCRVSRSSAKSVGIKTSFVLAAVSFYIRLEFTHQLLERSRVRCKTQHYVAKEDGQCREGPYRSLSEWGQIVSCVIRVSAVPSATSIPEMG